MVFCTLLEWQQFDVLMQTFSSRFPIHAFLACTFDSRRNQYPQLLHLGDDAHKTEAEKTLNYFIV